MLEFGGPRFLVAIALVVFSACAASAAMTASTGRGAPVRLGRGPHLFIDDYLIGKSVGLIRTTHQPVKLPEPVLRKGEYWHMQPQWSIIRVTRDAKTGLFRSWCNVKNPGGSPIVFYAYAESKDGITWSHPNLGLVNVGGSTNNSLIAAPQGHFGQFFVDEGPGCAEPSRRFKLGYYNQDPPQASEGMCVAFSPDGFHFTDYPDNPVIAAGANNIPFPEAGYENVIGDIMEGCWDPLKHEYLMGCKIERNGYPGKPHYHAEGWRRCVGMSTSKDFIKWQKPRLIITPDPKNGMEEFYGFKPMIRGDLYIGFLRVLRDDLPADQNGTVNGIGWTELMTSRDGRAWTRYQEKFIDRDPTAGSWDHAMAWFADCLTVGDKDYVYYGGYSAGHKVGDRQVGLAMMRKNGFVSRDAGTGKGTLRTPAVVLMGKGITVNANVKGSLRVRITDLSGTALHGFDWADCSPIHGDSVSLRVSWKGSVSHLANKLVHLEFELRQAELYGFDISQ